MKPQMQKYLFGNPEQVVGDCHRTCIAMLLNMDRDDVPHFMEGVPYNATADDPRSKAAERAEAAWLAQRGLAAVTWGYTGDTNLGDVLEVVSKQCHAPVILGCQSENGCNHSVVIWQGEIYNPNGGTIAGPMLDGFWYVTALAAGPNWQPDALAVKAA